MSEESEGEERVSEEREREERVSEERDIPECVPPVFSGIHSGIQVSSRSSNREIPTSTKAFCVC